MGSPRGTWWTEQPHHAGMPPIELAVARFPSINAAATAFAAARARARPDAAWVREAGLVEQHANGHWVLRGTFAGHYLDIDEALHFSERGATEGALAGAALGVLGGPPGVAAGLVIGGMVGSRVGHPSERDPEPRPLVEEIHDGLPDPGSAIALIAEPSAVDEMLAALPDRDRDVVRRPLTAEEVIALQESLGGTALASRGPLAEGEEAFEERRADA